MLEDHISEFLSSDNNEYQMNDVERKAADILFKNLITANKKISKI